MAKSTSKSTNNESRRQELEVFEPPPNAVYNIDFVARLAGLPRRTVLVCCKYGLVAPVIDDETDGYYFNTGAVHMLRRVAALRDVCGDDFVGIKIILELVNRLEQMQSAIQELRKEFPEQEFKSKPQRKRKSNRRYEYGYNI